MNYGDAADVQAHRELIQKVPIPGTDPVGGKEGPLLEHWKA